jgi:uncharacterized membrane protein YkoI
MQFQLATSLVLALVSAVPNQKSHQLVYDKRGELELPFYRPLTNLFETFSLEVDNEKRSLTLDKENIAFGRQQLLKKLGLEEKELHVTHTHTDNVGVSHVYAARKVGEYLVDNQNAAIHVFNGAIKAISSSIPRFRNGNVAGTDIKISLEEAISIAEAKYGASQDDFPATQKYLQIPNGNLVFIHQFQIQNFALDIWFQVSVDTTNGQIIQVVDYSSSASYEALEIPKTDVSAGLSIIQDPQTLGLLNNESSPIGWHTFETTTFTNTQGNNADSVIEFSRERVAATGRDPNTLDFNYRFNPDGEPEDNIEPAVVNAFYGIYKF